MNRMDSGGEAVVRYDTPEIHVLRAGAFVRCAITGEAIPLDLLKYWSVERQEAYVDAVASLEAELRAARRRQG